MGGLLGAHRAKGPDDLARKPCCHWAFFVTFTLTGSLVEPAPRPPSPILRIRTSTLASSSTTNQPALGGSC